MASRQAAALSALQLEDSALARMSTHTLAEQLSNQYSTFHSNTTNNTITTANTHNNINGSYNPTHLVAMTEDLDVVTAWGMGLSSAFLEFSGDASKVSRPTNEGERVLGDVLVVTLLVYCVIFVLCCVMW
jgi:hypothetical protein